MPIPTSVPVAVTDRDEALRWLFEEQYASLVRLAALLTDDRETAEDVVQEAFVRMYRAWDRVREVSAAPAYLRSIVLNLARSGLRRKRMARRRGRGAQADAASAEDDALIREDQRVVLAALRSLPRRQRECLTLRYYQDLSEAEIAEGLGISAGSVKSHSSRGIARARSEAGGRRVSTRFDDASVEERLRDATRAYTDAIEPAPDAWRELRTTTDGPPARTLSWRRGVVVIAAAAAIAVVALVATLPGVDRRGVQTPQRPVPTAVPTTIPDVGKTHALAVTPSTGLRDRQLVRVGPVRPRSPPKTTSSCRPAGSA